MMQLEQMEKKPFNPVIGEQHIAWLEHSPDNWSEYISEQVSHHPPVTAFYVRNQKEKLVLNSNMQISVQFGGNSASILSTGGVNLTTAFEEYKMSKVSPDMIIQRVVWGVKYFMWVGTVEMECPKTGYKLEMTLSEEDENTNRLVGKIKKGDEILCMHLRGETGKFTQMWKPGEEDKKEELYNFKDWNYPKINYPKPEEQLPMDSLKLWKPVADPIIENDLWKADLAKKKIEQEQRVRERAREAAALEYKGVYFEHKKQEDGTMLWVYNDHDSISPEFLKKLALKVIEEEKLALALEEERKLKEAREKEAQNSTDNGGGCIIS